MEPVGVRNNMLFPLSPLFPKGGSKTQGESECGSTRTLKHSLMESLIAQ